jgi:hypothetical protein
MAWSDRPKLFLVANQNGDTIGIGTVDRLQ